MEAIVHLDRPPTMPSQSQMAYAQRTSALHRDRGPLQESLEHYQRFLNRSQGGGDSAPYKQSVAPGQLQGGQGGCPVVQQPPPSQAQQQQQQQPCPQQQQQQQPPPQTGTRAAHSPAAAYSSYPGAMRFVHQAAYVPPHAPPAPTPPHSAVGYREPVYPTRTGVVAERSQSIELVRNDALSNQVRPRISLLPTAPDYLSSISRNRLQSESYRDTMVVTTGGMQMMESPMKKIRLGEVKPEVQQGLRIDTRDESQPTAAYNPQVEAISPTLPSEVLQEDANFRSTKDDLLHGIAKVDREITKTELQISKLKKIQQELEEASKKPVAKKEEEEVPQPKHQSPAQKIYAENRKKAQEAHALLEKLGPKIELPLYNQPSDTAVYHDNKRRHMAFKIKLLDHLRKKHAERENREKVLTATYSRLVQEWLRKVEKVENSQKRKAKEAKNREFFEKVFPKLRKQREDRERFNRVGARIKSEADLEEIMDGLQEQEMEDKKMRSYAVVPPLLLDAKQRSVYYVNNNGRVDDFAADYKERQLLNVWTQAEKEIFKEKFLQHPKNFGIIASYLERKSVGDCVQYYYLSKKTENYKRLLRKSRQRTRSGRNPHGKVNSSVSGPGNNLEILSTGTGVTTRLQREQLQKQEAPPIIQPTSENVEVTSADCDNNHASSFIIDPPTQTDTSLLLSSRSAGSTSEMKVENKKKDRRKEEKKKKEEDLAETSDEEQFEAGECSSAVAQSCVVCKAESLSCRALPRSQASQYGLKEDQVPADARVCNLCRCKAVRSRYTNCPLPTCPNAKGHRVKRLRPMPCKWLDLPPHIKDPIATDLQIDASVTKCCTTCFNRITRKISAAMDGNSGTIGEDNQAVSPSHSSQMLRWTDEETEALKKGIKTHGTRWSEVSQMVGPTKSQHQCKNFFFNYRKKLGLDQLVQEYNKAHLGEERKPVLTDEEESGSSTSSCDEIEGGAGGDSDTASAASPGQHLDEKVDARIDDNSLITNPTNQGFHQEGIEDPHPVEPSERIQDPALQSKVAPPSITPIQPNKEDYDSSATETADEGQGGGEAEPGAPRPTSPKNPRDDDQSSPLNMKDLVLGVIEMQLMKNQGLKSKSSVPVPAGPPTISSILKSDHSVNYPQREKQRPQEVTNSPLATLSVVGSHHSHPPPQEINKESLVVMQVSTREPEPVTLDLSIKKPRESNIAQIAKALPQHQLPSQQTHNIFRSSQPPSEQPPFYQQVVASSLAPKLSPKLSPSIITPGSVACSTGMPGAKAQCGSIIHGTPVSSPSIYNQSRYDQSAATLIRQVTPPHKETGSITQGTPVHQRTSIYPGPEYYSNKRTTLPAPSFYPPRPPAYNVEQRQIIMTDYVTSHQMPGATASAGSRSTREKLYYQPSPRQGVIQRHNTKPPSPGIGHYPPPPPGHEAFSSLVDVAVRQPSLPVPPPITISLPEHKGISSEEKRHLHEGLGERFNRESPHERFPSREQERYSRDNHKVHIQQPQTRESHHQPQHQIRDQQIRDQQMRDHQLHQIRENHQQIQHHRDLHQQQQIHQQIREQQMQREREQHAQQQKIRENHMQHMQQHRDIEQRPPRHQISNYPQRLIHDTHHSLDRHIQVSAYSREQQPPPQQPPVSRAHANAEQSVDGNSGRGRTGEGSTLTAASLIDAIITHQINQSSEGQNAGVSSGPCAAPQSQPTRPGDRLFQSFHRDTGPESNGKLSPMKPGVSPDTKGHGIQLSQPSIPLEHVEVFSISAPQGSRPSAYQGFDPQTWKLRRALQHKEVESLGRDKTEERNIVRYYPEPPVPLSPLDYVKNRIAEVMRTSEEEGATKSSDSPSASDMVIDESDTSVCQPSAPPSFITTSHTYTYPFSALSLSTGTTGVPISSQSVVKAGPEPVPEPAPLLSAQYEPLSDED